MPELPALSEREPGSRYDWTALHREYVEGIEIESETVWPSLRELARRHHALDHKIAERSSAEGWVDQRASFRRRIEHERRQEKAVEVARQGVELDAAAMRIARVGLAVVGGRMAELGGQVQARGRRIEELRGAGGAVVGEHVDGAPLPPRAEEVATLARGAAHLYNLGRAAIGDVPEASVVFRGDPTTPIAVEGKVEHDHDGRVEAIVAALVEARALPPGLVELPVAGGDGQADQGADAAPDEVRPA